MPSTPTQVPLRLTGTVRDLMELLVASGPSTVSNWRARYDDFPQPVVEGTSRAAYDLDEILAWARQPGTPARLRRVRSDWWWERAVDALFDQAGSRSADRVGRVRDFAAAFVLLHACLRGDVRGVPARRSVLTEARSAADPLAVLLATGQLLEERHPKLAGLLTAPLGAAPSAAPFTVALLDRIDAAADEGVMSGDRLDVVLRPRQRNSASSLTSTDDVLAGLVAGIATLGSNREIYDPCAGEAGLLLTCGRELGAARVVAQELDPGASRIARTRLVLSGLDFDIGEPDRSSIAEDQFPTVRAGLVVADPPVSPNSPLALWVDHALGHLADDGTAVIVMPVHAILEGFSRRRAYEKDLFDQLGALLANGRVAAVTVVPARLRADVLSPLTLWALRADGDPTARVRARRSKPVVRTTERTKQRATEAWSEEAVPPAQVIAWIASAVDDTREHEAPPSPPRPTTLASAFEALDSVLREVNPTIEPDQRERVDAAMRGLSRFIGPALASGGRQHMLGADGTPLCGVDLDAPTYCTQCAAEAVARLPSDSPQRRWVDAQRKDFTE